MKRVEQHIIEERSRKAFALLIPDSWAVNDFTKDYGKDIQLEIFKNYNSTGHIFTCQLKGTGKEIINGEIAISMEIDHLLYFSTLPLPMLLVFYSVREDQFWGIWANFLHETLSLKTNQKTVTIKLGEANRLQQSFFTQLETIFQPELPRKTNLVFSGESKLLPVIRKKLLAWLQIYFAKDFAEGDYFLPRQFFINIDDNAEKLEIDIKSPFNPKELTTDGNVKSLGSFYLPKPSFENICTLEASLIYAFALHFKVYSAREVLLLLRNILHLVPSDHKHQLELIALALKATSENCNEDLQQLINVAIDNQNYGDFSALNFGLFKADPNRPEVRKNYEKNLVVVISGIEDCDFKASLCYNLANYYRNEEIPDLAIHFYHYAVKLRPAYREVYYWWHELAGVLAIAEHYKWSVYAYEQSIALDINGTNLPFAYGLLANAQFHQGKFSEAKLNIELYLKGVEKLKKFPDFSFVLMRETIDSFEKLSLTEIKPDKQASETCIERLYLNPRDGFMEAIQLNPLNVDALFNQGSLLYEQDDPQQAFEFFLAAAVIYFDQVIWMYCLRLSLIFQETELAFMLLIAMNQIFGERVINFIIDDVLKSDLSEEDKGNYVQVLENLHNKVNNTILPEWYRPALMEARIYQ